MTGREVSAGGGMDGSVAISLFGGGKRILHQGCDGHRADTAGYRGNIGGHGGDLRKVNVAFEGEAAFFSGVGDAGDADVDYDSAGFNHGSIDKFGFAEGGYDQIALEADLPQVTCLGV